MSVLRAQVIESISGLADENLLFLLNMIDRLMKPQKNEKESNNKTLCGGVKVGMYKGETYIADEYDFDQDNDTIAALFEESA